MYVRGGGCGGGSGGWPEQSAIWGVALICLNQVNMYRSNHREKRARVGAVGWRGQGGGGGGSEALTSLLSRVRRRSRELLSAPGRSSPPTPVSLDNNFHIVNLLSASKTLLTYFFKKTCC